MLYIDGFYNCQYMKIIRSDGASTNELWILYYKNWTFFVVFCHHTISTLTYVFFFLDSDSFSEIFEFLFFKLRGNFIPIRMLFIPIHNISNTISHFFHQLTRNPILVHIFFFNFFSYLKISIFLFICSKYCRDIKFSKFQFDVKFPLRIQFQSYSISIPIKFNFNPNLKFNFNPI